MACILIVGAGGFIGRHAATALARSGHEIVGTVRPGAQRPQIAGVRWLDCDLMSSDFSGLPLDRCDAVVFLAQARGWRRFPETAGDVFAVNVAALAAAAELARRLGARSFVHASSGSVYSQTSAPARETEPIDASAPRSFYVATKLAGELLLRPYETIFPVVNLRLFMPYGTGQADDMLLPTLLRNVREERPVKLHEPDGLVSNPIAVADVAETIRRSLELDRSATLNVGGPHARSLRDLAQTIGRAVGREPIFESQAGPRPIIVGDGSELARRLGWRPAVGFESGLRDWLQSDMMPFRAAG